MKRFAFFLEGNQSLRRGTWLDFPLSLYFWNSCFWIVFLCISGFTNVLILSLIMLDFSKFVSATLTSLIRDLRKDDDSPRDTRVSVVSPCFSLIVLNWICSCSYFWNGVSFFYETLRMCKDAVLLRGVLKTLALRFLIFSKRIFFWDKT